jgi:hypothetical protein
LIGAIETLDDLLRGAHGFKPKSISDERAIPEGKFKAGGSDILL